MKKLMTLLGLAAVCAGFAACNNDDNQGQNDPNGNGDEIQVVQVNEEISEFFNDGGIIKQICWGIFGEDNGDNPDEPEFVDRCMMINSIGELPQVDFEGNPYEFPAIDFDNHTLVIGQYFAVNTAYNLVSQSIVIEPEEILMNTRVERIRDFEHSAIVVKYYWGIYPKLPQLPIQIIRNGVKLPLVSRTTRSTLTK